VTIAETIVNDPQFVGNTARVGRGKPTDFTFVTGPKAKGTGKGSIGGTIDFNRAKIFVSAAHVIPWGVWNAPQSEMRMGGRQQLPRDERPKTRLLCERDRQFESRPSSKESSNFRFLVGLES
jgi:hypothetical protein